MKSTILITMTAITLFAALVLPIGLAAQQPRYKLIDLGTFGGPNSHYFSAPVVQSVNSRGMVVGAADTPDADPDAPFCFFDCFVNRAFVWQAGKLVDLGVLPGGYNSAALSINNQGMIDGFADNGKLDPLTGIPEIASVVWKQGHIVDLGTLGGNFTFDNAMNNRGQVVGITLNGIPDPFSYIDLGFFGNSGGTQTRAFRWQDGAMLDLGTLGGPDSWGDSINEHGQVTGWAYTDSTPNPTTGVPTQHPFLWENGTMTDLGTLGGTLAVTGSRGAPGGGSINDRGEVIGTSNLAGDTVHHPFLWHHGALTDLGTLGGANGEAYWINNRGEVVGRADVSGSTNHHAVLWRHGTITDLGVAAGWPCSTAIDINARGQVVIDTGICGVGGGPGLLWENGVTYDLNTLVPAGSGFFVGDPSFINDRGEIAVTGVLPNGDTHDLLLVPCDEDQPGMEGCDDDQVDAAAGLQSPAPRYVSNGALRPPQLRQANRYHIPGLQPPSR